MARGKQATKPDGEQEQKSDQQDDGSTQEGGAGKRPLLHVPISAALKEELEAFGTEHKLGFRGACREAEEAVAAVIGSPEGAAKLATNLRDQARQKRIEFHRQELLKLEGNG